MTQGEKTARVPIQPLPRGVEGHSGYRTVATSPANDGVQCECGWTSDGYHDMTSYAHHDWLRHVAGLDAADDAKPS